MGHRSSSSVGTGRSDLRRVAQDTRTSCTVWYCLSITHPSLRLLQPCLLMHQLHPSCSAHSFHSSSHCECAPCLFRSGIQSYLVLQQWCPPAVSSIKLVEVDVSCVALYLPYRRSARSRYVTFFPRGTAILTEQLKLSVTRISIARRRSLRSLPLRVD